MKGALGCTRCEGLMAGFQVAFFLILDRALPLPIGLSSGFYLHCNTGCFLSMNVWCLLIFFEILNFSLS